MAKICILSTVNLKHMTLISHYTEYFDKNNIEYDYIYIDKYNEEEKNNAMRAYKYSIKINRNWSKLRKLYAYIGFRKYAKNIMNKNKYDYIIVWNSYTAFLFSDYLIVNYKEKYFYNIRDYCYEKIKIIGILSKYLIKYSNTTTISSDGFRKFLVSSTKLITLHSLNTLLVTNLKKENKNNNQIEITFIGYVRFFETDKMFLTAMANDNRFKINYYGEGAEILKNFCEKKNIKNVNFFGRFPKEETIKYLNKMDIVNNLYGKGKIELDTAISIKFYYALYLKIPILVYKGTYMEEVASQVGLGIVIDEIDNKTKDYIYMRYNEIKNNLNIEKTVIKKLKEISKNKEEFIKKLDRII